MRIIELTETQFMNYSNIHSKRNFLQSIEYANMQAKHGYNKLYLGLLDDANNVNAATLILEKRILKKYFYGIIPGGYLINHKNYSLLETFTNLLKDYLSKRSYIYLVIKPRYLLKVYDKNNKIIFSDDKSPKNLKKLGYIKVRTPINKHSVYLITNKSIKDTYKTFNRSTKNNIKKCNRMGISIYKGNTNDLETFYRLIRKKDINNIEYYKDYLKYFNDNNLSFELYFAKLNPQKYLDNCSKTLSKEKLKNEQIYKQIEKSKNIPNNLINKKIDSDKTVQKYSKELKEAMLLHKKYPDGVIVSTCAIIKTNREIIFLIDGYEEKLRHIRASAMMIWEVIKKYMRKGYKTFNLGFIPGNQNDDKFKNIYSSKMGFNGNLIEYPDEYNLVINKLLYNLTSLKK